MNPTSEIDFDLQSYFVNPTVLLTAVDEYSRSRIQDALARASRLPQPSANILLQTTFNEETKRFIVANRIPALEELLITSQDAANRYVTVERTFYFKGLHKVSMVKNRESCPKYFEFHTKLPEYSNLRLTGKIDSAKITTNTAYYKLSGRSRVFMLAYVMGASSTELVLRPVIIADKVLSETSSVGMPSTEYVSLRLPPEEIDEFRKIENVDSSNLRIEEMKRYPEKQIKIWLAEIIQEMFIHKDWGGEYSDLYTSHLHINGRRLEAAFLLKGPSAFRPMRNVDLGKNGDQIVRLFQEPADIYILQHCHFVTAGVRHTMEAFAARFYQRSLFCIIDGNDTLRILKAYGKI